MLRESPEDAEALALLGALYHREGFLARADAMLRRALGADPGNPEALAHLRAVTIARERKSAAEVRRPAGRPGVVARLRRICHDAGVLALACGGAPFDRHVARVFVEEYTANRDALAGRERRGSGAPGGRG
jgi:hypothetical protein